MPLMLTLARMRDGRVLAETRYADQPHQIGDGFQDMIRHRQITPVETVDVTVVSLINTETGEVSLRALEAALAFVKPDAQGEFARNMQKAVERLVP